VPAAQRFEPRRRSALLTYRHVDPRPRFKTTVLRNWFDRAVDVAATQKSLFFSICAALKAKIQGPSVEDLSARAR